MKTKEELKALKKRIDAIRLELSELTDEELREVTGGIGGIIFTPTDDISDDTVDNILP